MSELNITITKYDDENETCVVSDGEIEVLISSVGVEVPVLARLVVGGQPDDPWFETAFKTIDLLMHAKPKNQKWFPGDKPTHDDYNPRVALILVRAWFMKHTQTFD